MIKEMITRTSEQVGHIVNVIKNAKIEVSINLGDIIPGILIVGGVILGLLAIKKSIAAIKKYLKKQKEYNEGVKESISQIYKMINEYKKLTRPEEVVTEVVKPKKTRSMSMKERWADYEAKRATEREDSRQLPKEDMRIGLMN
ncbi:MAG: hypothetical protein ACYDEJ_05885 [Desulfitobacteriaceae bacterium]